MIVTKLTLAPGEIVTPARQPPGGSGDRDGFHGYRSTAAGGKRIHFNRHDLAGSISPAGLIVTKSICCSA